MTTLSKVNSQMADKSGDPLMGQRQANVADPGAITDITAVTTGQGVTVTSVAATDLDTAYADLALLENEVTALRVTILAILDVLEEHGLMTAS
jgi:hypothetical protein